MMNNYTLETVKGFDGVRRHFTTYSAALTAFHVQRCGGEWDHVLLWDNRNGEAIRQHKAGNAGRVA